MNYVIYQIILHKWIHRLKPSVSPFMRRIELVQGPLTPQHNSKMIGAHSSKRIGYLQSSVNKKIREIDMVSVLNPLPSSKNPSQVV